MCGWMNGWTDGAIGRLDEWVGVGLITAGYRMLPKDAARFFYRYMFNGNIT